MASVLRVIASVLLLAVVGLAACGVRGPLEPPPKAKKEGTAQTGAGTPGTKSEGAHRPFILDRVLR